MGSFSVWHWLIMLAVIALVLIGVLLLALALTRRTTARRMAVADRLQELAALRARGLISDEEFARARERTLEQL